MKVIGSTYKMLLKLSNLGPEEGSGIPGVGVKSVDIGRNTSGEGGHLDGD